ncbi:MAG: response regulator [Euryarchaeota archaeon]|nr:response regulator [Euryarchaeota archaeon]
MVRNKKKETKLLLIEDLEEHVRLIRHTLERSGLKKKIWVCRDGEAALDYLYNRGDYASKEKYPKPDIIVLDLGLPKLDGLEVLKRIKSEERLKDIPVVVLTVSEKNEDITSAYKEDAEGYLLKSAFIVEKTGKMEGLLDALLSFGYQ